MQINNEESIEGCINSNRLKDQLMIDSSANDSGESLKNIKRKEKETSEEREELEQQN
jgi:hypothetical protein